VIDDAWAIPGAQDPDVFVQVLRRMHERARAATVDACTDDVCDV
jgi:predicted DsbA family dithiol-disulfide isomerase